MRELPKEILLIRYVLLIGDQMNNDLKRHEQVLLWLMYHRGAKKSSNENRVSWYDNNRNVHPLRKPSTQFISRPGGNEFQDAFYSQDFLKIRFWNTIYVFWVL